MNKRRTCANSDHRVLNSQTTHPKGHTMPKAYDRERIGVLLSAATESQHKYWDALRELERALDCEIDGEIIDTCDVG
jgi:hypothetical protein